MLDTTSIEGKALPPAKYAEREWKEVADAPLQSSHEGPLPVVMCWHNVLFMIDRNRKLWYSPLYQN